MENQEHISTNGTRSPLRLLRAIGSDRSGVALIEAAFILPIILVLMMGVVSYSYWMLMAQSLQQVANDAARSTLAGLTVTERDALARSSVSNSITGSLSVPEDLIATVVEEDGGYLTVTVTYDGSTNPILRTSIVPVPSTSIMRDASVEVSAL